jgi:hypothetical protein
VGVVRINAISIVCALDCVPANCAITVYIYVPAVVGAIDGDRFKFKNPGTVVGVTDPFPPERDGVGAPAGMDFKTV